MTENAAATKESLYEPQSFSVEEMTIETGSDEIEEHFADEETDEPEVEVEGKTKTSIETEENESSFLRKEIAALKDEILKLSTRPKEKPPELASKEPEKTEKLTRAQIAKIMSEHKDDPEVLLNVIDYMAEQKANEIKDTTVKDINYRQWHSNLSGVANKIISEDEDGYLAANPKVMDQLGVMAQNLGLSDHPIGNLAAYAIYRLSEMAKAKPKEDAESPKVSKPTNSRVMDKTRTSSTTSKTHGLTADQLAVARKFGVKPETYAKFVRRS